eukprot:scaffold278011_cov36-Tisochrysis_lutea.AAC.1
MGLSCTGLVWVSQCRRFRDMGGVYGFSARTDGLDGERGRWRRSLPDRTFLKIVELHDVDPNTPHRSVETSALGPRHQGGHRFRLSLRTVRQRQR